MTDKRLFTSSLTKWMGNIMYHLVKVRKVKKTYSHFGEIRQVPGVFHHHCCQEITISEKHKCQRKSFSCSLRAHHFKKKLFDSIEQNHLDCETQKQFRSICTCTPCADWIRKELKIFSLKRCWCQHIKVLGQRLEVSPINFAQEETTQTRPSNLTLSGPSCQSCVKFPKDDHPGITRLTSLLT